MLLAPKCRGEGGASVVVGTGERSTLELVKIFRMWQYCISRSLEVTVSFVVPEEEFRNFPYEFMREKDGCGAGLYYLPLPPRPPPFHY